MKNTKLITGVLLIYIFGVFSGMIISGYYLKQRHLKPMRSPAMRNAFIVERLTRRLDLSEDQIQKVEHIVADMQTKSMNRFNAHHKEMRGLLLEGFSEIRKELTPLQQKKMDRLQAEFERRRGEHRRRFR